MSEPIYRVRGWNENFENNRSRDLKRLEFAMLPNRLDSDAYAELLDHQDGAAHFGAWSVLVLIASRCAPRGTLVRDGGNPHTPQSLARISRIPAGIFEAAIPRLLDISWLEEIAFATNNLHDAAEIPHEAAVNPHDAAPSRARENGQKGTELNGKNERNGTAPVRPSLPPSIQKLVSSSRPLTQEQIDWMKMQLHGYMAMAGTEYQREVQPPDDAIILRCLNAIGGAEMIDVTAFLRERFLSEQSPRHSAGPRGYPWFEKVLLERFGGREAAA